MSELITRNTIVAPEHLQSLRELLPRVAALPGAVAEVGVYRGGTARLLCEGSNAHVFLFDTFEGLPQEHAFDNHHKKGDFADTSVDHVRSVLQGLGNYTVLKGTFPAMNADVVTDVRFKFVHLDVDIYTSIRDCLAFFSPRMVEGGIIVLDDYTTPTCLGAKRATDEFLQTRPDLRLIVGPLCQAHIVIASGSGPTP